MRFLIEMMLSAFLEGSQYEKMPKWIQVLGLLLLTALVALSVFALSAVLLHAEQGVSRRFICLMLMAAILWYYIDVLKNFVRRTKRQMCPRYAYIDITSEGSVLCFDMKTAIIYINLRYFFADRRVREE